MVYVNDVLSQEQPSVVFGRARQRSGQGSPGPGDIGFESHVPTSGRQRIQSTRLAITDHARHGESFGHHTVTTHAIFGSITNIKTLIDNTVNLTMRPQTIARTLLC